MAEKSVAEKLHITPDKTITFFNPPKNNEEQLGGIDGAISISDSDPTDILLAYIDNRRQLKRNLPALKSSIKVDGALWSAYHKGSSQADTDINRDSIHTYAAGIGLKSVGMISINDDWSAFRFKIVN